MENSHGKKVKTFRTDNGGEYTSNESEKFLTEKGILHEMIVPKTCEQNGIAKGLNRTHAETSKSLLRGMKKDFSTKAMSTAVYLPNGSPASTLPHDTT